MKNDGNILIRGEFKIFNTNVKKYIFIGVSIIYGVMTLFFKKIATSYDSDGLLLFMIGFEILWGFILVYLGFSKLSIMNADFIVTDTGIQGKIGFFNRQKVNLVMNKVKGVKLSSNLIRNGLVVSSGLANGIIFYWLVNAEEIYNILIDKTNNND